MSRPRVLVADDDPLYRAYLAAVLRKDFIVAMAGDGEEAVRKGAEHPPDCAVIDVQMPGVDGIQTMRRFRAHPALRDIPVVILSADTTRSTVMAAITGGAADYLVKGKFEDAALVARITKALTVSKQPIVARPAGVVPSAPPRPRSDAGPRGGSGAGDRTGEASRRAGDGGSPGRRRHGADVRRGRRKRDP